jgi:pyridoxal phosphate enzyme (YggS family)
VARRDELAENLRLVRERIEAACRKAGRAPDEVTLIAVTKTYPAEDVALLASLGVTEVGENRDQEAAPKAAAVETMVAPGEPGVRWHFIGQLQRNKCKSVVAYADVVHSVDSVRLAGTLAEAARRGRDRPLDVLVQVSIDGDPSRGGAVSAIGQPERHPDEEVDLDRVLASVAGADSLRLRGLMAVAPLGWEPERAFAALADISAACRASYPTATWLSAGMSHDVEQAIDYGSTHVRVGTALLGNRAPLL